METSLQCEICNQMERKYKCPRCGITTCSLACCLSHKSKNNCNGIRDRSSFVAVKDFKDRNLMNDYHFLEDILQTKNSAKRTYSSYFGGTHGNSANNAKRGKTTEVLPMQSLHSYPHKLRRLLHLAKEKGVSLLLQPTGMYKRKDNSTKFRKQSQIIDWQLMLVFLLDDRFNMSELLSYDSGIISHSDLKSALKPSVIAIKVRDVDERKTINQIIEEVLHKVTPGSGTACRLKQHLPRSSSTRTEIFCSLLRKIPSPANQPLFVENSLDMKLSDVLKNQTVIEYPTLYICHKYLRNSFRLLIADTVPATNNELVAGIEGNETNGANNNYAMDATINDTEQGLMTVSLKKKLLDEDICREEGEDSEQDDEEEDEEDEDEVSAPRDLLINFTSNNPDTTNSFPPERSTSLSRLMEIDRNNESSEQGRMDQCDNDQEYERAGNDDEVDDDATDDRSVSTDNDKSGYEDFIKAFMEVHGKDFTALKAIIDEDEDEEI